MKTRFPATTGNASRSIKGVAVEMSFLLSSLRAIASAQRPIRSLSRQVNRLMLGLNIITRRKEQRPHWKLELTI